VKVSFDEVLRQIGQEYEVIYPFISHS